MPVDPRRTGVLDNFERASENPLSYGGRWGPVGSDRTEMKLNGGNNFPNNHATRQGAGYNSYSRWDHAGPFSGDCEIWGWRVEVGHQIGHNERLGLHAYIDPDAPWVINGYEAWCHTGGSGHDFYLFKYVAGARTTLLTSETDANFVMLRRFGTQIQVWRCNGPEIYTTPSLYDWTLTIDVTDTTFAGVPLWAAIGEGDNFGSSSVSSGWRWAGGGAPREARPLPQIIRRTHRRGGLWKP